MDAKVLEIGAPFTSLWYHDLWKDLAKVGPRLTTLRLEVITGMIPEVAVSVKGFVRARFRKGVPLTKLERMTFGGMSKRKEEGAKKLWEEFRAGLDIDRYLSAERAS